MPPTVLEALKAVNDVDDALVESVYNKLKALGLTEEQLQDATGVFQTLQVEDLRIKSDHLHIKSEDLKWSLSEILLLRRAQLHSGKSKGEVNRQRHHARKFCNAYMSACNACVPADWAVP
jgi:hypothetical protein